MAVEKQAKSIGGFTYEVTQLGAKVGNRVLMKIAKSVGPLLMVAVAGRGAGGAFDPSKAVEAIQGMSEDDFEWVLTQLASRTTFTADQGGAPIDLGAANGAIFDQHFAGRYAEELAWLEFAIEANYGPFFQGLKAKAAGALAA